VGKCNWYISELFTGILNYQKFQTTELNPEQNKNSILPFSTYHKISHTQYWMKLKKHDFYWQISLQLSLRQKSLRVFH